MQTKSKKEKKFDIPKLLFFTPKTHFEGNNRGKLIFPCLLSLSGALLRLSPLQPPGRRRVNYFLQN